METKASIKYFAEFLGTLTLVLIGCGSVVLTEGLGPLGIGIAFGFTVIGLIYTFGHISGAHFNPAVTIGMIAVRRIGAKQGMMYIIFQCLGAIAGAGVLYLIASGKSAYTLDKGLGATSYSTYSTLAAFCTETLLTMLLLITIFAATSHAEIAGFVGIVLGFFIIALVMMGFSVSGTGINPARSIGPALFVGGKALEQLWLYITAPIVGAILAAGIWRGIFRRK